MNKTFLLSSETLKTIGQGALGAITFSAYHQYNMNQKIELGNEKCELRVKYFMDKLELQHKTEMNELRLRIKNLEQK